jgi:hypothetical protein
MAAGGRSHASPPPFAPFIHLVGSLVAARTAEGQSLAAVSREIGMHKDWLSRHPAQLDPMAAILARQWNAIAIESGQPRTWLRRNRAQ